MKWGANFPLGQVKHSNRARVCLRVFHPIEGEKEMALPASNGSNGSLSARGVPSTLSPPGVPEMTSPTSGNLT